MQQWQQIVDEHSAAVYRLAYRLTGNRHDAEDLTQDVFVKAFASPNAYEADNFAGWIHRVTTNAFLDGKRRDARRRTSPLGEQLGELADAEAALPEFAMHDAGFDPDVEGALQQLAPQLRVAVILHDVEQLSIDEVAAVLGLRTSQTRSRVHRGRRQLRTALEHRAPRGGRTRFLGAVGV